MARIKSTLEIALERASRFEMDEAEVREARVKSHLERVLEEVGFTGEAEPDLEKFRSSLAGVPGEIEAEVRILLLRNLFGRLELTGADLNVMAAAAQAAPAEQRRAVEEMTAKVKESLEKKTELAGDARAGVVDRLRARGISGSAVKIPDESRGAGEKETARLTEEILKMAEAIAGPKAGG